jgi:tetratricopeptide (TPR) repeat protein
MAFAQDVKKKEGKNLPSGTAQEHLKNGVTSFESQNYATAIDELVKCIQLDPYLIMGTILMDLKLFKEAINDFTEVLKFNPNNIKAYNYRGNAKILTANEKGAIEDFTKAIELDSNQADAYSNRAIAHYDIKEYKAALSDFQRAIKNHPESFNEFHYLGLTKYQLNDHLGAIEEFNKAIALDATEPSNYYFRGDAHMALNQKKEACSDFKAAQKHGSAEAKDRISEVCK